MISSQPYGDNGIVISKLPASVGDKVEISYTGILASCGAEQIFLHAGYNESWEKIMMIPMKNEEGCFKAEISVDLAGSLNFTFKDNAENWDNNSSQNYSLMVNSGEKVKGKTTRATKVSTSKDETKQKEKTTRSRQKDDGETKEAAKKTRAKKSEGSTEKVKKTTKKASKNTEEKDRRE
jgi:hypothetical protein